MVLLAAAIVTARGGDYLTQANLLNMLTRTTALGIVAVGQTIAILAGSLDLSVAYLIGLTSLIAAETMAGDPAMIVPGVLAVLAVSALVGLVNGLVITKLQVNAFIATLGVGLVIKGILESRYQGPAGSVPVLFQHLGYDRIGPIPVAVLLMLAVAAAAALFLHRTRPGHHVYAVGGNVDVARLSGVPTDAHDRAGTRDLLAVRRPRRAVPGQPARRRRAVRRHRRRLRPGVDRRGRARRHRARRAAAAAWPAPSAGCCCSPCWTASSTSSLWTRSSRTSCAAS